MDKPKHTPGPWKLREEVYDRRGRVRRFIVREDYPLHHVARVTGDVSVGDPTANGLLLATAPELAEALKLCMYALDRNNKDGRFDPEISKAWQSLRKAGIH